MSASISRRISNVPEDFQLSLSADGVEVICQINKGSVQGHALLCINLESGDGLRPCIWCSIRHGILIYFQEEHVQWMTSNGTHAKIMLEIDSNAVRAV